MGFRSKSISRKKNSGTYDVKITKEDQKNLKYNTNDNQLLNAVNEAQPFQEASDRSVNRQSMGMFLANKNNNVDTFGIPIRQPDVSNPSRSRDERPLDTIRSFEFAITGDNYYKDILETPKLGFRPRPEFPLFKSNPYANNQPQQHQSYEQPVYTPAPMANIKPEKKKRGLFGRKK
ncbi:hypothetical protein DASC09_038940 [Saccharomycopsis crataegensis]|uniref:Uncharacterized protein n=1 Tax=Saccharomycopsis crataegensis TaxID=43959 RepID=A0AAV5QQ76_9ASCO|nr:hypothetical protein DASC09_038940 [Saccharomycopsis crataegensis]